MRREAGIFGTAIGLLAIACSARPDARSQFNNLSQTREVPKMSEQLELHKKELGERLLNLDFQSFHATRLTDQPITEGRLVISKRELLLNELDFNLRELRWLVDSCGINSLTRDVHLHFSDWVALGSSPETATLKPTIVDFNEPPVLIHVGISQVLQEAEASFERWYTVAETEKQEARRKFGIYHANLTISRALCSAAQASSFIAEGISQQMALDRAQMHNTIADAFEVLLSNGLTTPLLNITSKETKPT